MLYRLDFDCYAADDEPCAPFRSFELPVQAAAHRRGRLPGALIDHAQSIARAWIRGANADAVAVFVTFNVYQPVDLRPNHEACAVTSEIDRASYDAAVLDRIDRYPVAQRRGVGFGR